MLKPIICSWLMEDKLVHWIHYIPINDDFSDLQEKYTWCLNNIFINLCFTIQNFS